MGYTETQQVSRRRKGGCVFCAGLPGRIWHDFIDAVFNHSEIADFIPRD
jgi:hypothetical protein